jgi:Mn-dependent DtxR family transcriptional regulator
MSTGKIERSSHLWLRTCGHTMAPKYTFKQGQYLAFIHYYAKLNGCAPAERDMQRYFKVTPPTVHQMVMTLEKQGLISREP